MFFPTLTPSGTTEHSPIVTSPELYILGSLTLGTSSPTPSSYWEANMELIDIIPVFNLYEEFWKIYTRTDTIPPQYIADNTFIEKSIIGDGTEVYGRIYNSVIGSGVTIEEGAVVRDSIIMNNSVIAFIQLHLP